MDRKDRVGEPVGIAGSVTDVLSDLLQHSLRIVLCGTAAGTTSAAERAYYAHRQNKFWKILHATGLTPELLQPRQYRSLLQHGIGLTDLVKAGVGMDRATLPKLTAADRARLRNAIATFRPQFLAFTSKTAGQKFFDGTRDYGEQSELDRRHQGVDIAVDFGRRQWKLASGNLAPVCG